MKISEHHFEHRDTMFDDLRDRIVSLLMDSMEDRGGRASIALAGGTTPAPLYERLSRTHLLWDRISVTPTDERILPPDHRDSNFRMLRNTLAKCNAADVQLIPFRTVPVAPWACAAATDRLLHPLLPFDLCLLGMGADGHIASLFPGADGYDEALSLDEPTLVAPIHAPGADGSAERLSLTLSTILKSRHIILLFTGPEKMAVYKEAKAGLGNSPIRKLLELADSPVQVFWAP